MMMMVMILIILFNIICLSRSLAFQSLVLNSWLVEEFLPGEENDDDARNLRLFTRDCEGEYKLTSFEEELFLANGRVATEDDKMFMRTYEMNTTLGNIVSVIT